MKILFKYFLKFISFIIEIPAVILLGAGTILWTISLLISQPQTSIAIWKELKSKLSKEKTS